MPYKDPAKRKERCKIYYQDNQESLKAKRAEWREKNKEQTNKKMPKGMSISQNMQLL